MTKYIFLLMHIWQGLICCKKLSVIAVIGESRPFSREIDSCKKKRKNRPFQRTKICITSLWEDLEDNLLTPGQLLSYSWKLGGITVQTSYVEGWWHQTWVCSRLTKKIMCGHATSWKMEIFRKPLCHRKFSRENFRDEDYRNRHGLSFQNIYMKGG